MTARRNGLRFCVLASLLMLACKTSEPSTTAESPAEPAPSAGDASPTAGKRCVVHLHGKSGTGGATETRPDYTLVLPTGNGDGWGGKQWLYFPDARLAEVRTILTRAIADNACGPTILNGFSNGAAAVAKLYCRGETLGGHVIGYVIDDPVPDHGADTCSPVAGTKARLYWTGELAKTATPGWNCSDGDWTCEGGSTLGISAYAANLALTVTQSVNTQHVPYPDPPEHHSWW